MYCYPTLYLTAALAVSTASPTAGRVPGQRLIPTVFFAPAFARLAHP